MKNQILVIFMPEKIPTFASGRNGGFKLGIGSAFCDGGTARSASSAEGSQMQRNSLRKTAKSPFEKKRATPIGETRIGHHGRK